MNPDWTDRSSVGETVAFTFARTDDFWRAWGRFHSPRIGVLKELSSVLEKPGSARGPTSFSKAPLVKYRTASEPPLSCTPYSLRLPSWIGVRSGSLKTFTADVLSMMQVTPVALAGTESSLSKHLRWVAEPGVLPRI